MFIFKCQNFGDHISWEQDCNMLKFKWCLKKEKILGFVITEAPVRPIDKTLYF